jgi:hypothetical protein
VLELGETERLQEKRDRSERDDAGRAGIDAHANDRKIRPSRSKRQHGGEAGAEDGLQNGGVDLEELVLATLPDDDRLVSEARNNVCDEPLDLGCRLSDEYAGHALMIAAQPRMQAGFRYGDGMTRRLR